MEFLELLLVEWSASKQALRVARAGGLPAVAEALPCAQPLHSFVFFIGPKLSAQLPDIFYIFHVITSIVSNLAHIFCSNEIICSSRIFFYYNSKIRSNGTNSNIYSDGTNCSIYSDGTILFQWYEQIQLNIF